MHSKSSWSLYEKPLPKYNLIKLLLPVVITRRDVQKTVPISIHRILIDNPFPHNIRSISEHTYKS